MAYGKNGVSYPSVTTILGMLDKPALIDWAARMVVENLKENEEVLIQAAKSGDKYAVVDLLDKSKDAYKRARDKAAGTGTMVHKAIENYTIMGIEPDFDKTEESQMVKSGFEAYLEWADRNHVKFLKNEIELCDEIIGYAGTADGVCEINGSLYLIDFKTSKGIYDEHKYQISAYKQAWQRAPENAGKDINLGILKLDKETGVPEFLDVSAGHDERIRFFNALVSAYYKQKKRRLKNNPFVQKYWGNKKEEVIKVNLRGGKSA